MNKILLNKKFLIICMDFHSYLRDSVREKKSPVHLKKLTPSRPPCLTPSLYVSPFPVKNATLIVG